MKKQTVILLTLVVLFVFAGLISCTKKEPADTPYTRIIGKWKKTQYATDDNNNGQIDPGEIHNVPSTLDDEMLFTNEGTGVETTTNSGIQSTALSFSWKIVDVDSVWVAYKANDTLTYYLAAVSSHNLQLTTNTTLGLVSYYYSK